jgi:hypothetical protein
LSEAELSKPIDFRRLVVFGSAVIMAGLAITVVCLVPLFFRHAHPISIFPDPLEEEFFFDLFGLIGACWLTCFVMALCAWKAPARVSQWLGIILLSIDQVVLFAQWQGLSEYHNFWSEGIWLAPALLEVYFIGLFFSFFTLPALTISGNRRLTALGTLVVLLPWLIGRAAIIMGTRLLP